MTAPTTYSQKFNVGDVVVVNENCQMRKYIGLVSKIVTVIGSTHNYLGYEYKIQDSGATFWEHELISINDRKGQKTSPIIIEANFKEKESEKVPEDKTLWI